MSKYHGNSIERAVNSAYSPRKQITHAILSLLTFEGTVLCFPLSLYVKIDDKLFFRRLSDHRCCKGPVK